MLDNNTTIYNHFITFYPYFFLKDSITLFIYLFLLFFIIGYYVRPMSNSGRINVGRAVKCRNVKNSYGLIQRFDDKQPRRQIAKNF